MGIRKIKQHYTGQASQFGTSKQSTMLDFATRDKEVETIVSCLSGLGKGIRILEVGSGNGYTAEQIKKNLGSSRFKIEAIDFTPALVEIARSRKLSNVKFQLGDVRDLKFRYQYFDVVISERCLINLTSWEDQKKALLEIWRVLKPGGAFLMLEAFTDGLDNLNNAREAIGLSRIPQFPLNIYFDKAKLYRFLRGKFTPLYGNEPCPPIQENFLSSYYFGSRVLYPALAKASVMPIAYNTAFVDFFKYLPSYGNYSFIQMLVLERSA